MKSLPSILGLFAMVMAAAAQEDGADGAVRGVNPADNLTKFEILPKFSSLDDDARISLWTTTLKFDQAIQGRYGLNLELPLAAFTSPFLDRTGIGDLNISAGIRFLRF